MSKEPIGALFANRSSDSSSSISSTPPQHRRSDSSAIIQKSLNKPYKSNTIYPNLSNNCSIELPFIPTPQHTSPESIPASDSSNHRRMTSTVLENDDEEPYLDSLRLSFSDNKGKLDHVELEKFLSSWEDDLNTPPQNTRLYHRISLIKALKSLKAEIKQDIQQQRSKLLALFKQVTHKKDKEEIKAIIEFLKNPMVASSKFKLADFALKIQELPSSYLKLRKLAIQATQSTSALPLTSKSKQLPSHYYLPLPHPNSASTVVPEHTESEEQKSAIAPNSCHSKAYSLAENAMYALYSEFNSKKSWLDPRTLFSIELIPKHERLACLIEFSALELKTIRQCWQNSCFCFYQASSRVNKLYKCLAELDLPNLTEQDVKQFKNSLREIADYMVMDDEEILDRHLRFHSSSSAF